MLSSRRHLFALPLAATTAAASLAALTSSEVSTATATKSAPASR